MASRTPPIGFASPHAAVEPAFAETSFPSAPGREPSNEAQLARAVLSSSPDAIWVVDDASRIRFVNPSLERLLGRAAADLVGTPVARLLGSAGDLGRLGEALRGEAIASVEVDLSHANGGRLPVSLSISPLWLPSGRRDGIAFYARDLSAAHKRAHELARKNAELEHYVDAVSHDLRSPLMSLRGFTRLLDEDYGDRLDDKGRHFLRRVQEAGRSMEDLIESLLELSRMERTGPSDEQVDPREVLLQLQAELKPRLDETGAELELPADAPLVRCQRTRLYQALSNLVVNALDHAEATSPQIQVRVETTEDAHVIRVADNGTGIPSEHHARIFEMFQSLGPRRCGARGNGMGLAIVSKAAEIQGGRAWVESAPGAGTTFSISLPRC